MLDFCIVMIIAEFEITTRLSEVTIAFMRVLLSKLSQVDLANRVTQILTSSQLNFRFNLEAVEVGLKFLFPVISGIFPSDLKRIDTGKLSPMKLSLL